MSRISLLKNQPIAAAEIATQTPKAPTMTIVRNPSRANSGFRFHRNTKTNAKMLNGKHHESG